MSKPPPLLALLLAAVLGCGPDDPVTSLTREFDGAYPATVAATGAVREYTLDAAPTVLPMFDGRPLHVWAYDGTVPGPILRARVGERLRVTFTNRLPDDTTVHWHGVRLPNAMDGAPGVTQPPVKPGDTFVYDFVPRDAGTFWFHPHLRSSEQVERGLYGVLIVDEAKPPPYSRDVVWVLDDWRLGADGEIDPRFNTPGDLMHDGRWGNVVTVNGKLNEVLEVRPGERIRLRLLDTANGRVFEPDFGELTPQVIAVDGLYTPQPLPLGGFELAPGNRLDLDLTVPSDWSGREIVVTDRFTRRPFPLATIRVAGEPVPTPDFPSPAQGYVPTWRVPDEVPVTTIDIDARRGGPFGIEWTLNGLAHVGHHAMTPLATLPRGRFAHLRFTNRSYRLHPMHIHGTFFKVLARNGSAVDEPYWRDTALVHPQETIDVGLVPLDVGDWMLHCHILEHAEAGMMTTVRVSDGS
ncbi:MAG TPA: multicopper oxidase family protein [Candidatus Binatia bacterium]|jgi:FtsP/CotA-like multicopper oxidase with cupredoxin domain|nr:multicopper oxidase family protein [Candidatus Binatia bacterium]